MDMQVRPQKRQRMIEPTGTVPEEDDSGDDDAGSNDMNLLELIRGRHWDYATNRVMLHPQEASGDTNPSPLALACRYGAPPTCVDAILKACPGRLRHLLDSRGTPLHEAVVCDEIGPAVIRLLLQVDEELGSDSPRAAIMQDVDGYTPLHLLIRRRFQAHVMDADAGSHLMELLEMLVKSCAEAVVVPDRGEYEEPPIVMALKANVYAPMLQSEDDTAARIERNIYDIVDCMLRHYPNAASCVFSGYRGKYTALHSAVFHGRCPKTIDLLLQAENRSPSTQKAGILANTQGELPLHFCAMRGEPPRSVALLAQEAPEAVSTRDSSGLTPVHWLWTRFVSTMLAIDDGDRDSALAIPLGMPVASTPSSIYSAFASLEQENFEPDLQALQRIDPPVDFLRMRHVPAEVVDEVDALQWAQRCVALLQQVRDRYNGLIRQEDGDDRTIVWSRLEAVCSFFWTKVVSLLRATSVAGAATDEFSLVRTAFQSLCCPPPVSRIIAEMYPEEMTTPDVDGRLPLHFASMRKWHAWDWPRGDGTGESANAQFLQLESVSSIKTALSLSANAAARHKDRFNKLPIHYVIPSLVNAFCTNGRSCMNSPVEEVLEIIKTFVRMNPESLQEPDPETGLPPFLQASAAAAEEKIKQPSVSASDEFPLSIVYLLLHENPSLLKMTT